jgi:hypothetical protein
MFDKELSQLLMCNEEMTILWACVFSMTEAEEEIRKIGSRGFLVSGDMKVPTASGMGIVSGHSLGGMLGSVKDVNGGCCEFVNRY